MPEASPDRTATSTNRWVWCSHGHKHWGSAGAAGLMLAHLDPDGQLWVLLQHRAVWVHEGDTWSVPGGALHEHEPAVDGAFRELVEEAGLDLSKQANVLGTHVDDHGGWSYTTVLASAEAMLDPDHDPDEESAADPTWERPRERFEQERLAWWPVRDVHSIALHPGFAGSWTQVSALLEALVAAARDTGTPS